jgi:hypothetical protein
MTAKNQDKILAKKIAMFSERMIGALTDAAKRHRSIKVINRNMNGKEFLSYLKVCGEIIGNQNYLGELLETDMKDEIIVKLHDNLYDTNDLYRNGCDLVVDVGLNGVK